METKNYEYKSEVLKTTEKWGFKDSANKRDLENLDNFFNKRVNEGWEFVTHTYMPNVLALRSAILLTFRKSV